MLATLVTCAVVRKPLLNGTCDGDDTVSGRASVLRSAETMKNSLSLMIGPDSVAPYVSDLKLVAGRLNDPIRSP